MAVPLAASNMLVVLARVCLQLMFLFTMGQMQEAHMVRQQTVLGSVNLRTAGSR